MLTKLCDDLEITNKDEIIESLTNYKFRINGSEPIEMNDIYIEDANVYRQFKEHNVKQFYKVKNTKF